MKNFDIDKIFKKETDLKNIEFPIIFNWRKSSYGFTNNYLITINNFENLIKIKNWKIEQLQEKGLSIDFIKIRIRWCDLIHFHRKQFLTIKETNLKNNFNDNRFEKVHTIINKE